MDSILVYKHHIYQINFQGSFLCHLLKTFCINSIIYIKEFLKLMNVGIERYSFLGLQQFKNIVIKSFG